MNIYVRVICIFSFVFVFTSTAILQYTSVCHVVSAGAVFVLYGAGWLCFHSQRVFPDDAMETRRTGGDARARISWQLNRRLLTSLTGHKRANVECVCACTCACVCVTLREKKRREKNAQTIWTGLSQLAVKADFREFRACSPTCFAPHAATATCPRKCPLSLLNLSVSGHEKAARSAALAQTQVQVKVICLTHTHAPAQTNEGTGEQPKCFDTLSCAEVNGVVVRLCKRVGRRVFLPNPFTLVWLEQVRRLSFSHNEQLLLRNLVKWFTKSVFLLKRKWKKVRQQTPILGCVWGCNRKKRYCDVNLLPVMFFPRVLYCLSHLSESVCVLGGLPPPGGPCSALSAPVISYCTHSPFVDFTCKSHVLFSPLSS